MKKAYLIRHYGPHQTLGHLFGFDGINKIFECKTLELPWKENKRNVSCIPGNGKVYMVDVYTSPSKGKVYLLQDVESRSVIEIHVANFKRDLLGCIAPGIEFYDIDGDGLKDVTSSRDTLEGMFDIMGEQFQLTIV